MTLNLVHQLHNQRSTNLATKTALAYHSGFKECSRHTIAYLSSTHSLSSTELSRLKTHLHNSYNDRIYTSASSDTGFPDYSHKRVENYDINAAILDHRNGNTLPVHHQPIRNDLLSRDNTTTLTFPTTESGSLYRVTKKEKIWRPW